jgi:hypothetical protein
MKKDDTYKSTYGIREVFAIDMYFLNSVRKMINRNCASGKDTVLRSCGTETEVHIF